jgi:magnesium-transporting ATPase (P-type)
MPQEPNASPQTDRANGPKGPVTETAWHARDAEDVLSGLEAAPDGLTGAEAARRSELHGPNRLPAGKPRSALVRFLLQFHNVLIYVLIAAAAITAALGHWIDTAVILLVVVANAGIGFVQEGRAERALDAIRDMISPQCSVMREGRRITLSADELVPGDVVVLDAGDRVPADLRLLRARNLTIDEAVLTGESVPAEKQTSPSPADAPLGDRRSMAFSGSFVTAGHGSGVVVATGTATELGRISQMLGDVETLTTPLVRNMNRFARQLTIAILSAAALVFAFAVALRSYAASEAFIAVVALAVAAIPEGLPAVMTITLAIGVQRMAARSAIIRKLPAVETLGSVTIICSDKTGTFTHNEMTVAAVAAADDMFEVTGAGYEPRGSVVLSGQEIEPAERPDLMEIATAALLCNDASLRRTEGDWTVDGDPMEGALVSFAIKLGLDAILTPRQHPRADEIPFDAEHRFMATLNRDHDNRAVAYLKGAPETVTARCDRELTEHGERRLDHAAIAAKVEQLASKGQRVLALAFKPMPADAHDLRFGDVESELVLLGLVGLIDPPREAAVEAVSECRQAGIAVKMITGDHAATASAIARQLGLDHADRVTTGQELEQIPAERLADLVGETAVFARASPEHKLRIVEALQSRGAVVAMTGDGVNDAPALKRADVGIAMGRKGTEVAKEAAQMVLADDNFASIVAAVREGRTVYDNLKKVIGWTLPTNGGQAFAIVGAILFGVTLPVSPVQILWVNMITAVALGLTLAFEPTEPNAMRRPPRPPTERLLSGFLLWRIMFVSALFVAGAFGMFFWALARGLPIEEARTIVVNTLVVLQIFYLFEVRYLETTSVTWAGVLGTPAVLIGLAVTVAAQFAFTYLPAMQLLFDTRAIAFTDGVAIVGVGVALLAILEIEKTARRALRSRRGGRARA